MKVDNNFYLRCALAELDEANADLTLFLEKSDLSDSNRSILKDIISSLDDIYDKVDNLKI